MRLQTWQLKGVNMKQKRQQARAYRIMLSGFILCVFLGAASSISLAALASDAGQTNPGGLERPLRVFDPFALRTILVSDVSTAMQAIGSSEGDDSYLRPSIRVPYRPSVRSAFRPGSD
jgi:hypothetical protein